MPDKILNSFPGYEFVQCGDDGKPHNMYRGTDVGMGGYVYFEPGMYENVALIDVASMHPASILAMNCFGEYTQNYADIRQARIYIKHGEYDKAKALFNGRLSKYLDDPSSAKELSQALKIALNSVYGLTAANFDNPFRDVRNKNNIVALRGALFMRTLQDEIQSRGFTVAHVKTDSMKIPDATPEIIKFCMEFAKKYGYEFEHEATYDRMCLVNGSTYIAKYASSKKCEQLYGYSPGENVKHENTWTATAAQFQVPYVFKKLFSREPIEFEDMCETFAVTKGDLYLDMNENLPDVSQLEKELFVITKNDREPERQEELKKLIADGHDYKFVGRVGQFCPIKPGNNGGVLYRVNEGKNYAAPGSSGYRWLESEMVKTLNAEDIIDRSFYDRLVDDAVDAISKYGDFEMFISDDPGPKSEIETPPWMMECGRETCDGCPNFSGKMPNISCDLGHDISDLILYNQKVKGE